ncbi:hypothetical protein BDQ17DRAFT_1484785 [Cyathus striatus]|nr:hypothetical protein BDQ17DRAFT_1484785 [Cyathus striatus]
MSDIDDSTAGALLAAALTGFSHEKGERSSVDLTEPELFNSESKQDAKSSNTSKLSNKSQQQASPLRTNHEIDGEHQEEERISKIRSFGIDSTSRSSGGKRKKPSITTRENTVKEMRTEDSNEFAPIAMQPSELTCQILKQGVDEQTASAQLSYKQLDKQSERVVDEPDIGSFMLPSEERKHREDDLHTLRQLSYHDSIDRRVNRGRVEEDSKRQTLEQSNDMSTTGRSSSSVAFAPRPVNQGTSELFHGSEKVTVTGGNILSVAGDMIQRTDQTSYVMKTRIIPKQHFLVLSRRLRR